MALSTTRATGDQLSAADMNLISGLLNAFATPGIMQDFFGLDSQVPNGFLGCSGKTIGDGSSGATARANADQQALFAALWTTSATAGTLTIQNSSGTPVSAGASAAADWAAHRRITLPDCRGRATVGKDDIGGGARAGVVANAQAILAGGSEGEENHTLSVTEIPSHTHNYGVYGPNASSVHASGANNSTLLGTLTTDGGTGGGQSHNNMQPSVFVTKMIFTGVTW